MSESPLNPLDSNLTIAEMFRDEPVFSASTRALLSQRVAEAGKLVVDHCNAEGRHFGVISISYRELASMMRVFGPHVMAEIHRRVIDLLRLELPSECYVAAGQTGLVIVMMDVNRKDAFQLALRLEAVLCTSFQIDGIDYGVNFILSTGEYPGFTAEGNMTSEEFHRLFAVYEDENYELFKQTGTRVFAITEERFEMLSRMHDLDRQMREDFSAGRFHLHYQPRVELVSGRIVGAEALMRWNSSHRGAISPSVFIPIAENNGFIHTLTPFALRTVARDMASFKQRFGADFSIGVNISGTCIRSLNLVSIIQDCLSEFGLTGGGLEVEITESQLIDQRAFVIDQLDALREAGVATALDDFGTGFSSLNVLTKIPLDYLKLDRSFVTALTSSPRDRHVAVAKAITEMGKACGMTVIAEGMESEKEVRALIDEVGCPLGQGFFFAKPMSLEAFLALPNSLQTLSEAS